MSPRKRLVIFGAGGFAREVRWLAEEIDALAPSFTFVGYVVSDLQRLGAHDSKKDLLGEVSWLREHRSSFDSIALAIGTPAARTSVGQALIAEFGEGVFPALVHPSVKLDRKSCKIGPGALLCAGVVATVNVEFGPFALVNLQCTLGHEAKVGWASVLNPSVNLSGGVTIGPGVLVGTGAQVLQYLSVGAGATVGSGAVVVKDVPAGETVVGIPARPIGRKEHP